MANNDEKRPEPESLLELSKVEEEGRGKLTIYFGFAPGVGKTYAMLSDARQRREEGLDVVVGYYEAHARPETEELLEGQEVLPPKYIEYKGIKLKEMDLDKILSRRPQIVLVDELAHTNAPGMSHVKRYQDVEDLQNAGIDVYATMNVQHLESVNDVLFQITGMRVREKVPDTVFHSADEVKLIDLPFEELLKRLHEGKVYLKDMAKEAVKHFFQPGNLMALRELALRLSAGRVDEQLRRHMRAHAVAGPWLVNERILVSVYASPHAERLVRSAYRLATEINAEWVAMYVEEPSHARLSETELGWLTNALNLAKTLGAQVVWRKSEDAAGEISRYVGNNNITKIVMGKPGRLWFFPTIVRKIMTKTRNVDIFLFAGAGAQPIPAKKVPRIRFRNYLAGLLSVGLISLLGFFFKGWLGETNLLFLMLVPVIWTAVSLGRGPSICAAVTSIVVFDYLFVPPFYSFAIADFHGMISFVVYIAVAVIISNLASRLRNQVKLLRQSESMSNALIDVSRHLMIAGNVEQVLTALVNHVRKIIPCDIAIFLPHGKELCVAAATADFPVNAKEQSVATWVYINGKVAGRGTDTLSQAMAHYLPMRTAKGTDGVMGIRCEDTEIALTSETENFFDAIAGMGAMAIDRIGPSTRTAIIDKKV